MSKYSWCEEGTTMPPRQGLLARDTDELPHWYPWSLKGRVRVGWRLEFRWLKDCWHWLLTTVTVWPRHQSTTGTVWTVLDLKPDDHIYHVMVKLIDIGPNIVDIDSHCCDYNKVLGRVRFSHGSTILTSISHYDSIGYKLYYRKTWFSYVIC